MDNVDCEFVQAFKKEEGSISLGTGNLQNKERQGRAGRDKFNT